MFTQYYSFKTRIFTSVANYIRYYFNSHRFHSLPQLQDSGCKKSFSILHCNIRSIQANFDNLNQTVERVKIYLQCYWFIRDLAKSSDNQCNNVDLPGYSFISQPTTLRAGGVGLYIKNNLRFNIRHELSSSSAESEML